MDVNVDHVGPWTMYMVPSPPNIFNLVIGVNMVNVENLDHGGHDFDPSTQIHYFNLCPTCGVMKIMTPQGKSIIQNVVPPHEIGSKLAGFWVKLS